MAGWQAKKFQLPNHNFETTAIKFDDGRVGLCYHGNTIWQHESGGWEGFIDSDWKKVWKEGTPCSFKELPPDMRINCPVCGARINPDDAECSQCGIIFDKIKTEPADSQQPGEEEARPTPRSKIVDLSLALVVVLIAGIFIYTAFKPEPPQPPPDQTMSAEEQSSPGLSGQPSRQPDAYQHTRTEPARTYEEESPSADQDTFEEEVTVEPEEYYSHINLDDPETAHRQLQEETNRLNEEAGKIKKDLLTASTPEEKRRAREEKIRYDHKIVQLSQLIKEFNSRNEGAQ